jgi:hypothetical protein
MRSLVLASAALVCAFAAPAMAGQMHRHHHHRVAYASGGPGFQGGVLTGPLYNGQDYLGTDPDPNIRSYILRDLGSRYGGR